MIVSDLKTKVLLAIQNKEDEIEIDFLLRKIYANINPCYQGRFEEVVDLINSFRIFYNKSPLAFSFVEKVFSLKDHSPKDIFSHLARGGTICEITTRKRNTRKGRIQKRDSKNTTDINYPEKNIKS